jgi:hypothetical protein
MVHRKLMELREEARLATDPEVRLVMAVRHSMDTSVFLRPNMWVISVAGLLGSAKVLQEQFWPNPFTLNMDPSLARIDCIFELVYRRREGASEAEISRPAQLLLEYDRDALTRPPTSGRWGLQHDSYPYPAEVTVNKRLKLPSNYMPKYHYGLGKAKCQGEFGGRVATNALRACVCVCDMNRKLPNFVVHLCGSGAVEGYIERH